MILYVNGDSHTAAAEAVNPHAFAEDDTHYGYLKRLPHPDNLAVSWGKRLSETCKYAFKCDAQSASSNSRIMRTTRQYCLEHASSLKNTLMIIQWSTWERQEWLIDGIFYQVTASGTDDVPEEHQNRYRNWILDMNWHELRDQAHAEIWEFHNELCDLGVTHVFFNGNNDFSGIDPDRQRNWGNCYIGPYDPKLTYNQWLLDNGYYTVSPESWHFGKDAHAAWSHFMLQYIVSNKMIK